MSHGIKGKFKPSMNQMKKPELRTQNAIDEGPAIPLSEGELMVFKELGRPIPFERALATVRELSQRRKDCETMTKGNQI